MRVRITRLCHDEVDGVPLMHFVVGVVYEVGASLGTYLVSAGCAEAVLEEEAKRLHTENLQFAQNVKRWRQIAAEFSRRRPR